jgi:DNA (cytosine-5)-methyltransferase 1
LSLVAEAPARTPRRTWLRRASAPGSSEWLTYLNESLQPSKTAFRLPVLDLFAGCGGLALGFEAAGFSTTGYELSEVASATYNANLVGACHTRRLHPGVDLPSAAVIIGGPPCQPFSTGGKRRADRDERNGIPAVLDAIERMQPELAIIENVRGLTVGDRRPYFLSVLQRLRDLKYEVVARELDAALWRVPQHRRRVFVVAHRGGFEWPTEERRSPTSVRDAIGDLLTELPSNPRWLTPSMDAYVARYEAASKCRVPRDLRLELPSRTVTCRNLAGATGDMIRIRLEDGRRRRLEVREAARLQAFPDWFQFDGSATAQFEQIGNAVPPLIAKALASQVARYLRARGLDMRRRPRRG